ncbi:competence/damage-inducible protein A [Flavitalea sp. BT771]|uniref:competence/damage-inducible protein A n=1 Tax=Flavitalea sp. BT771 TaxID=3063329 RepID=UPI0026E36FD9|nr:competence/damage-inducible protein A [Flavitalea sp. BT771]MDO6432288.1 competence/damage-inducible protein A [Flavitalea sp. BT771]MDV6221198.1 competence/damage-inducible protein A [Flavitalea sp. BT771]
MEKTAASIITIGDELLIGQVIDTNSAWMAQELNKIGVWVRHRLAVGDVWDDIWKALDEESAQSQIILITGGLGPTADDITKPLLNEYFGGKIVVDEGALANVKHIFEKVLQRPMIERNLKQAEVPDVCKVIQNKRGTAPGMWFEKDNKIFVSMPGVPNEMKGMMTDAVLPALREKFRLPFIAHRTLLTAGIGESFLAEHISAFETALPSYIRLAYLPNYGMVRLRLTIQGEDPLAMEKELQEQFDRLRKLTAQWMVIDEDLTLQEALGKVLKARGRTVGTAESCTGGYIAHLITSIPGSSQYFKGSVVSYANEVKQQILGVSAATLETAGAVSEETVREMAAGALAALDTDYVVVTSGIMGPDGGSAEKPVGTAWVAVANRQRIDAQRFWFRFDRQRNIELTATNALNLLRKFILADG